MASAAACDVGRLRLVYGLLALLYLALCLDLYLTARIWRREDDVEMDGGGERVLRRHKRYYDEENEGPSVEFFPQPQPTHQTEGYRWVTSYSRIPVQVLKEFCLSVKEHCPSGDPGPPGKPGTPGYKGDKGERGDRGLPGESGPRGPQGFLGISGPVGPKGEHGTPGIPGLDGRDGIPGEPGLDGVPGRDGIDGIPGRDGIPGIPGTPGRPGTNGTHGIPGSPGPRGPPGPPGPQGLPGPRGKKGVPGKGGTPGVPGIKAWSITNISDSKPSSLLIPPSIIDVDQVSSLLVDENHRVKLECSATGKPEPQYSWRSDDEKPLRLRAWQLSSFQSNTLEISKVSREHMGVYMCIANNGIPPPASKKIKLEVAFPPLIKIKNQMVGTVNGSYALLECFVEAHPAAVNFWVHGERQLESNWKYRIEQIDNHYRSHMILNITRVEPLDYGLYRCISKNEKGKTHGLFTVFEHDPNTPIRKPSEDTSYEIYGQPAPPSIMEPPDCEPCVSKCDPAPLCPTTGSVDMSRVTNVVEHNAASLRLSGKDRKDHCMIHQLGKPVFQHSSTEEIGAWFQDALPSSSNNEQKFYATYASDTTTVYEYANRDAFRANNITKRHELHFPFVGTGHLIYNGSFYYHQVNSQKLARHDFANSQESIMEVDDADFNAFLYNSELVHMDVMADENGLWLVYAARDTNNTLVRKLNPFPLATEHTWNVTLPHHSVGEMFIACGVLYAVDSVTAASTRLRFAFDLYQDKVLEANIPFSNPFRNTSMVAYNPKHKKIFSWDKGNQLVYPILFGTIDMGQPDPARKK